MISIINLLLGIISFMLTTVIGLYLNTQFKKHKDYKNFLERLNKIVGLGGRILYQVDGEYNMYQIENINNQGVTLKGYYKTIYIPISKLMQNEIIIPEVNYDYIMKSINDEKDAEKQELNDFKHKKYSEIYAHTFKDIIKTHLLPEIEKLINNLNKKASK